MRPLFGKRGFLRWFVSGITVTSNIEQTQFRDDNQSIGGSPAHQPAGARKIALSAPARAQSGRLVCVERRSLSKGTSRA
jgi:hypothetical protein